MNHYCVLTLNNTPLHLIADYYGVGHPVNYERVNEWMNECLSCSDTNTIPHQNIWLPSSGAPYKWFHMSGHKAWWSAHIKFNLTNSSLADHRQTRTPNTHRWHTHAATYCVIIQTPRTQISGRNSNGTKHSGGPLEDGREKRPKHVGVLYLQTRF